MLYPHLRNESFPLWTSVMMMFIPGMVVCNLSDSLSPVMFYISSFHDHILTVLSLILGGMIGVIVFMVKSNSNYLFKLLHESESLEIAWTILPCLVLLILALPSIVTLYLSEESSNPVLSVKVMGHQWYWSFEYDEFGLEQDSYMISSSDLIGSPEAHVFRLLDVDNPLVLPSMSEIRFVVSSSDVIHSFSLPSLGVKIDAVPGRLNQVFTFSSNSGFVYGQCSEICGSSHSFMPLKVLFVPCSEFESWLFSKVSVV